MLQNANPLRKSVPRPPNISDEHVCCTAPATRNASFQILFKCPTPAIVFGHATKPSRFPFLARCRIPCTCNAKPHLNLQKRSEHVVSSTFWLGKVLRATTACTFSTSQLQNVLRSWCACTFWLGNMLRATTARTFSTAQLLKVLRRWCALHILTSKCASRHNIVQKLSSLIWPNWLRTRRFSEPTFRPSVWKNTVFRDFSTFSRACIFFLLTLSLLWSSLFFSPLLSSSLLFSASSHLCFSICPYCRKFDF